LGALVFMARLIARDWGDGKSDGHKETLRTIMFCKYNRRILFQENRVSLLRDIQAALLEEGRDIGPIFLKLRFLAARLGSDPLEEWVKHESEGYPHGVPVPDYRMLGVSYSGSFSGPFNSGIRNAPIPPYLIEKYAGKQWTSYEMRQSIAAIDDLISSARSNDSGSLTIDAANLILLLQGKIYEDYACNSVTGTISQAVLAEIQHVVRTRVLELTLELEKRIPAAADIALGPVTNDIKAVDTNTVTKITNQIIHGNVTAITSSGASAQFIVQVNERDREGFRKALIDAGIADEDAKDLADIVANEEIESPEQPWGTQAKAWLAKNIGKAANGTWRIGLDVATRVLTEAAMKYYGLK
jgi:hypothetical protein